jgi:cysteine desulfurase
MSDFIYMDYAATTPVDARIFEAMVPYFSETFGNPSSIHRQGQRAEAAVENARESVAANLHCLPSELVFTSCGSESDNLAIRGTALARREISGANRIITTKAEHHAVSKTAAQLEKYFGFQVDWLETDEFGMISPEMVQNAIMPDTAMVSIMLANNEVGTINPIEEIAAVCHARGVPIHTDAVQAAAYLPLDLQKLDVDLLSLGGHKFYGPKGVGALFIKKGTPIFATQTGGGQEMGLRSGTQNVPYIVGFAEAYRLACQERDKRVAHILPLRDAMIGHILEEIPHVRLTGHPSKRLPNHASFAFMGVDGNFLLTMLDAAGFACSSGSACKTGNPEPSEVMTAIGLSREWGLGSLRVTLGSGSRAEDVTALLKVLPELVEKARILSLK